eukprot:1159491-Pelagomonas_calceolata.AAC.3
MQHQSNLQGWKCARSTLPGNSSSLFFAAVPAVLLLLLLPPMLGSLLMLLFLCSGLVLTESFLKSLSRDDAVNLHENKRQEACLPHAHKGRVDQASSQQLAKNAGSRLGSFWEISIEAA